MENADVFNSVDYLEPKCPKCKGKIDYGVTTEWDDNENAHKCKDCGEILK